MKQLMSAYSFLAGDELQLEGRLRLFTALAFAVALAVCGAFGIVSWQAAALSQQKTAEIIVANQSAILQQGLSRSLSATYALAAAVQQGNGKVDGFEKLATDMLALYGGISSLQLAEGGIISQVVPLKGNEMVIGHDLLNDPRRGAAARLAIGTRQLTLAGPFELIQGGMAVIGRLPVFLQDPSGAQRFWGLTTALIRIPELLASSSLGQLASSGYHYQLAHLDPQSGKLRVFAGSGPARLSDPVVRAITVPNGTWQLSIEPVRGWVDPLLFIPAALAMVVVSAFVALFTHTVLRQPIHLRRQVAARTAELARINHNLNLEIDQRERAQRTAAQLNRLYSVLSHTSGTITRVTDRERLFQEICDVAVQHGRFPLATIALRDAAPGEWSCVSRQNDTVQIPQCDSAAHYLAAAEQQQGSNLECPEAQAAGFASHVMFSLACGDEVVGMFCLYAYEPDFFDAAQLRLLGEMTDDVSFALANIEHEAARKRSEAELRKLSRAVEQSANAVLITNRDGIIEYVNPWFTRITGYSPREVIGRTPRILRSRETTAETHERLWSTLLSGKEWHGELHNTKKNGDLYWCLQAISPLKNEKGDVTHFVAITEDISERKQTEQTIRHLAFHDVLTGLPNRRLFRDRLNQAIANGQRNATRFALMLLDLDHFKTINDTLGHDAGDALLQVVAERLSGRLRSVDTLARMGGDEFALLAVDISTPEDVARLAASLQTALSAPIKIHDRELYLSTSVGITLHPGDGNDVDSLIKNADIALYRAKDLGRDNYQFFTSDMNAEIIERLTMANSLRGAIERQEFILHYQPQVDLLSGQIRSVEALIRWQHPELGTVSPAQFIPLAEETGMIGAIGEWVLRTACAQARAWELAGMPLRIAVNLSARQFRQGDLANKIENILREADLSGALLEVEMTEGILMEDTEETSATLDTFHRMGLQISIDDFGTGYSSLSYLKRLPIDILKIDQSFVRDIHIDPDDRSIVTAIIALAHSLHLQVVAEGVETPEQLDFLREQKCDTIQGYLFSRPVPGDQILALLRSDYRLMWAA
jgi:diguanylate cyclase (GGDEF)-like protein/PAS domain S-box-containing protein